MNPNLEFYFRNKLRNCITVIDSSEFPCLVFVEFEDAEIIYEFGDEITLKTDCEKLLAKKDDYPALTGLRQSILNALKGLSEFSVAKEKIMSYPF